MATLLLPLDTYIVRGAFTVEWCFAAGCIIRIQASVTLVGSGKEGQEETVP